LCSRSEVGDSSVMELRRAGGSVRTPKCRGLMLSSRLDTNRTRHAGCVLRRCFVAGSRGWRLAYSGATRAHSSSTVTCRQGLGGGKGASSVRSGNSTGSCPHSFCDTHRRHGENRRTLLRTAVMQAQSCTFLQVACRLRASACGGRGSRELLKHSTASDALAVSVNLRIAFRPACLVRGCLAREHARLG